MPDESITVTGLEETMRMLADAPKEIVAAGYVKALNAAANVIADALEIHTPVKAEDTGGLLDKGVLRESLMTEVQLDSQLRGGTARIGFGKNGFVALWVEYGHRMVSHKSGGKKQIGEVRPHPFMRPTADASAEAAIQAFANSLQQTVATQFPQGKVA